MSENILETINLFYDYSGLQVLTGVDLQVRKGERHAIIGPNGAGKTTLFNVITGMFTPSKGKIMFKGRNVSGFKPYKLSRLGMGRSFQITSTFHKLTTFENIRMGVLSRMGIRFNMYKRVDKMEEVTRETNAILERINLKEETAAPADALSYGKHRSLEVSLAMSTNPDLVMLDEPTAGMSRDETHNAVDLIRRLTEGKTMVIVEHDMDVVFSLADRITVLHHGKVLAVGKPDEIRQMKAVKDAYLGHRREV